MKIPCFWEHNRGDTLLYAVDLPGAFTRGESLSVAITKMPAEIKSYLVWRGDPVPDPIEIVIAEEKESELDIRDADSDAIFDREKAPLTREEYEMLKSLALRSAKDFQTLYESIPDKDAGLSPLRKTFYGQVPHTAREMYVHTKSVNTYYFGEIGVEADNEGDIYTCRKRGFEALEAQPDFLQKPVIEGSYGEYWSLRKMLRRFIWHDRIHARAMWRGACRVFGVNEIENPFRFV
ncbi:MAG: hypothetical protein IJ363_13400 [Clostridia bacterium]|nr:hypothetical protein [Clostridia bacterium]